jgi:branched-chain amino acid transport system permease protein
VLAFVSSLFINGLVTGSMFMLVALGVTLFYGVLRIINLAHGDVFMVGAYIAFYAGTYLHLPYWAVVIVTMVACAVLYPILDLLVFRRLRGSELGPLITSVGLSMALESLVQGVFTANAQAVPSPYLNDLVNIGTVSVPLQSLLMIPLTLAVVAALYVFLRRTRTGLMVRAVAMEPRVSQLMGVRPEYVYGVVFVLAGLLVGLAAATMAPELYVTPTMGVELTVDAYIVVVIGGFGNVEGAIVAAFILGLINSFVSGLGLADWATTIALALLVGFMMVRPSGLVAERLGVRQ